MLIRFKNSFNSFKSILALILAVKYALNATDENRGRGKNEENACT